MSALLENMLTWYETAKDNFEKYKKNTSESRYLRSCCNHIQQTFEFAIKGMVERLGYEYRRGHDLEENTQILIDIIESGLRTDSESEIYKSMKTVIGDLNWVMEKSDIIAKWEQKPRYDGENFYVKEGNVTCALDILDRIVPLFIKI